MKNKSAMCTTECQPLPVVRNLIGGLEMSMSDYAAYIVMLASKPFLTKQETVELFDIGINKLDALMRDPSCPFVTPEQRVGNRKVHREGFERYLLEHGVYGEV